MSDVLCSRCGLRTPDGDMCTACGAALTAGSSLPSPSPAQPNPPARSSVPEPSTSTGSDRASPTEQEAGTVVDVGTAQIEPAGSPRGVAASGTKLRTIVVLVGVLVAVSVGGFFVVRGGSTASDEAVTRAGSADGRSDNLEGASRNAPGTDSAAARCWDGSKAATVDKCPEGIRGVKGLGWVFPSFSRTQCVDFKQSSAEAGQPDPAPAREEVWRCPYLFDGGNGEVRYYAWKPGTREERENRYRQKFVNGERREIRDSRGRVRRIVWLNPGPNEDGEYELTSMYVGLPFSMSVYAVSYADLEQALAEVLRFRDPANLRGAPRANGAAN